MRFDASGNVVEYGQPRETRIFGGKPFLMETALHGDVAILRAHKVDKAGNCVFRYTTRSFGPLMAKAARVSIVEAEEIVEVGEIDPGEVDLPGIYIDRIVPATDGALVEILKTRSVGGEKGGPRGEAQERRDRIARRAARELKHGFYVNLGVGRFFSFRGEGVLLTWTCQESQHWHRRFYPLAIRFGSSPRTASWAWATTLCPTKSTRE